MSKFLAHGLPPVAVDCMTGPRELIRDGENGLLVPQDNHDALVAALDRMMGDEALRHRLGTRAAEAHERFSVDRVAQRWEKLFDDVMENARA